MPAINVYDLFEIRDGFKETRKQKLDELVARVREDYPDYMVFKKKYVAFHDSILPNVLNSSERCTIQYKKNSIQIPYTETGSLPLVLIDSSRDARFEIGTIEIPEFVVAGASNFPMGYTFLEGSLSRGAMVKGLSKIYDTNIRVHEALSGFVLGNVKITKHFDFLYGK